MATLIWCKRKGRLTEVAEAPFKREEELERYVFNNPAVLGDLFLLKRQIRQGGKRGVPDIVGMDDAGQVCIIELKNTTVDEDIVPQVLSYAIWAQRNPDSIKSLWLEAEDRPEEVEPDWDNLPVRIIIVAPDFRPDLARMAAKINYPVEMVALRRFVKGRDEFLWLDRQTAEPGEAVRPAVGLMTYDRKAIGESKRFFERWRTLPGRSIATSIAGAERSVAAFATV
jgi:hypothetical protein